MLSVLRSPLGSLRASGWRPTRCRARGACEPIGRGPGAAPAPPGASGTCTPARGFSLVELMVTVAIIAVLAALAIYGVSTYLGTARSAEAKNSVGAISRGAVAAYERELSEAQQLPEGSSGTVFAHLLCGSSGLVPAVVPKGNKYQPSSAAGTDYALGDAQAGWPCLKYASGEPSYYQYGYTRDGSRLAPNNPAKCVGNCFEAGARGDLDGDGLESAFAVTGHINLGNGQLRTTSAIFVENEHE